jgi:hypothetical protein
MNSSSGYRMPSVPSGRKPIRARLTRRCRRRENPEDVRDPERRAGQRFDCPLEVQGRRIRLSGSIGASVFPEDSATSEALISNADIAMYRAKQFGRNNCLAFTPELGEESQQRVRREPVAPCADRRRAAPGLPAQAQPAA